MMNVVAVFRLKTNCLINDKLQQEIQLNLKFLLDLLLWTFLF